VQKGHQSFESAIVSQTPGLQQTGFFVGRGRRGFVQTAHTPLLGAQGYHTLGLLSIPTSRDGIAVFALISRIKEQMRMAALQLLRRDRATPPISKDQTRRTIRRVEE